MAWETHRQSVQDCEPMNQAEEPLENQAIGVSVGSDPIGSPGNANKSTERTPVEGLRPQEQQYQTLIEAIPQLVWMTNAEGMPDYFNQRWLDYTAYAVTSDLEANWAYLLHPEDQTAAATAWMNAVETGEPYEVEYRLRRHDGMFRWFLVRGVPVRDDTGQIVRWFGTCTDIDDTRRKQQIQEFLAQLDARIRPLADPEAVLWETVCALGKYLGVSRCGYTEIDLDLYTCTNHRQYSLGPQITPTTLSLSVFGEEMLSYSKQGIPLVIANTRTDPLAAPNYETVYAPLNVCAFLTVPLLKQGRWIASLTVSMTNAPRAWTEDEIHLLQEVVERTWLAVQSAWETQERQRAVNALRAAEAQLRLVTDAAPLLIAYMDRDQHFRFNNGTYAIWFERPLEEITGKHVREVLGSAAYEGIREYIEAALSGQTVTFEYEMPYHGMRHRYVQITFVPNRGDDDTIQGFVAVVNDLTERKRAEQDLLSSEIRFRMLVEQSPLSIQILAPDGRTLQVNRAWEQLWGVTLDDLQDYNMLEDQQLIEKGIMPYIQRAFSGEAVVIPPVLYDVEQTLPDRTSNANHGRWTQAVMYPVQDEEGSLREVVLIHEDITERMQATEALRDSERLYRTLGEAVPDFIWSNAADGRGLFVNQRWTEYTGFTLEQAAQVAPTFLYHPEDYPQLPHIWRTARINKEPFTAEFRFRRHDEIYRWYMARAVPLLDAQENIVQWIGTMTDIHERKMVEQALAISEARARRIFDSNIVGMIHWNLDTGLITHANEVFLAMVGYTREDLEQGRLSWREMTPPEWRERNHQGVEVIRRRRSGAPYEQEYLRKDGSRVPIIIGGALFDDSSNEGVSFILDITEQKRVEREGRQHLQEIEALNVRLQRSLQETHHRVKNNLQIISSLVEVQTADHENTVPIAAMTRIGHHTRSLASLHDFFPAQWDPKLGIHVT